MEKGETEPQSPVVPVADDETAVRTAPSFLQRFVFQKRLVFAVYGLSVYVFKLSEDVKSVKEYNESSDYSFLLISVLCLVVPPLFYSLYLMGQNLTKEEVIDKKELGTRAVNGALLYPWQIKRHLDVLHFTAQRVCQLRPPDRQETQDLQTMERNAEVLEFFEDLYSGFLQILLQVYLIFLINIRISETSGSSSGSGSAKYILTQLFASCLSVLSMLVAVRRRDDGIMTGLFSFVGWSSLILSRVLVISLAATVLHGWIALLSLVHILAFSIWIYQIAIESHMANTTSGSGDNVQWATTRKRVSTGIMVFLFFGIPSLLIWPIMFQLKERKRPLIFLLVMVVENALLLAVWFFSRETGSISAQTPEAMIVGTIVFATVFGTLFLLFYVLCKPKLTDQVVLYEIRESRTKQAPTLIRLEGANSRSSNTTQYGIYYEFCDLVFNLPSTHKIASELEEIRTLTTSAHHTEH